MVKASKTLDGYVKTQNLYFAVMVALAMGFIGGVIFSSYRTNVVSPPQVGAGTSGPVPMTKKDNETLAALIQATETTPGNVDAWTRLGHFYFDSGDSHKAIEAYERSLQLDDKRPDVWTDLGVMYRRIGNPAKAVESFDQALALNSRHEVALFNKGVVLMHDMHNASKALESWDKLVDINPDAQTPGGQTIKSILDQMKKEKQP